MRPILLGLLVVALTSGRVAAETKVALNGENTKVEFVGSKADGKHEGGFKKLSGTATLPGAGPAGMKVEVEIDADSLYSDNDKLTAHLKSPDFFGVKANPTARFVSSKVEKAGDGYMVTGDLTLCGRTRGIAFPAQIRLTDDRLILTSEFTIDRRDFGMTYGQGTVDNDVRIKVAVDAKK